MNNETKKKEWLNNFKVVVTKARDARLNGSMQDALRLDEKLDKLYKEARDLSLFDEEYLYAVESDTRNA